MKITIPLFCFACVVTPAIKAETNAKHKKNHCVPSIISSFVMTSFFGLLADSSWGVSARQKLPTNLSQNTGFILRFYRVLSNKNLRPVYSFEIIGERFVVCQIHK